MSEEEPNRLSALGATIVFIGSRTDLWQATEKGSFGSGPGPSRSSGRRYPSEIKDRAVRMVRERCETSSSVHQATVLVARQLGIPPGTLRNWVRDAGIRSFPSTRPMSDDAHRIVELEREVRDLRRANQIFAAASASVVSQLEAARVAADTTQAEN
ncbi:transposase [Microbispora sp. H10949]|uniref:transposase n=1 Tax=Microbispora sp. H10949 TaxID=2729111 RepID=UPI0016011EE3